VTLMARRMTMGFCERSSPISANSVTAEALPVYTSVSQKSARVLREAEKLGFAAGIEC